MTWHDMTRCKKTKELKKKKKKEKLQWLTEEKGKKGKNKKKQRIVSIYISSWCDMTWHDMKKIGENKKKGKWKKIQ